MIGRLKGTIVTSYDSNLIVDIQGVGYKVAVPKRLLHSTGEIALFIHTHVREDLLELYGFESVEDLKLFELLIGVSGVGCKSALGVFALGKRGDIIKAIQTGDATFFTSVPRLGKKNAQKIIIELKNKLGGTGDIILESAADTDVLDALQSFGFSEKEAAMALRKIEDETLSTPEKVKLALKYLGR
jgi:holliday junction DNA helicase RuvA